MTRHEVPTAATVGADALGDGRLSLFDVLPGAVMVAVDHVIVYANPAAIELFGVADLAALVERERARAHVLAADIPLLTARLAAIDRRRVRLELRPVPDRPPRRHRAGGRVVDAAVRRRGSDAVSYAVDDITSSPTCETRCEPPSAISARSWRRSPRASSSWIASVCVVTPTRPRPACSASARRRI